MAHFAKVRDGFVVDVIVAEPEFFDTFVDDTPGEWIQTSYNTKQGIHYNPETGEPSLDQSKALRKNFACIGGTYDAVRDAFIPPKPFDSFILNEETCDWLPPIPYPDDGKLYTWNESTVSWDEVIE